MALRAVCAVLAILVSVCSARGTSYEIEVLGDLGGGFARARAINSSGAIVGESLLSPSSTTANGFLWNAGQIEGLGTIGGLNSRALDINFSGIISGWAQGADGVGRAVLWDADGALLLPSFDSGASVAWAVNDEGTAVGHAFLSPSEYHATRWDASGGIEDLGTLGGSFSIAYDINSAGLVAGTANDAAGVQHATLWDAIGPLSLYQLGGGKWNTARGVNDSGGVILWGIPAGGTVNRAAFWDGAPGSDVFDLGTLGGQSSWAYGLNNPGSVVGSADLPAGNFHGFIWNDGEMTDLGTLGGLFSVAYGISDTGVVVGYAQDVDGHTHAVRWLPIPEPSILMLLLPCGAACLSMRRRILTGFPRICG